jgi:hypothetical protein
MNNTDHNLNVGERPNIPVNRIHITREKHHLHNNGLGVGWDGTLQSRVGQTVHNISPIPAFKKHISPQNHAK